VKVVVYASIRDKEVNAKTVKVVVYASIRDKEVHAKIVSTKNNFLAVAVVLTLADIVIICVIIIIF
jgi:hypothetical protein